MLLSFHNDPKIKEKYLARVKTHREQDAIIQGTGWENGKGCAVGCTLEDYKHSLYPIELGLPVWLARLEDAIFEGLPLSVAVLWPERFLSAINVGSNLDKVLHQLSIRRMDRLLKLQKENNIDDSLKTKIIEAILGVRYCHQAELDNAPCDWNSARKTSRSAVEAAAETEKAAEAAAYSAGYSALLSAGSAAESALWLAAATKKAEAAQTAAWQQEANDLIELLKQAY